MGGALAGTAVKKLLIPPVSERSACEHSNASVHLTGAAQISKRDRLTADP